MTTTDPAGVDTHEAEPGLGRDYWRLLVAGTISNLGDGVDGVALPLLAATLTRDPLLFALVATAQRAPWLLFALQAGALADRFDRRRTMAIANVVRSAALGLLAVTVVGGVATIQLLVVTAFVLGTFEVLFDTSAQAFLPRIVRRDQLERANGLQMGAEMVANSFVGPPLGGLLFAAAASLPLFLDAGSFAVSVVLLLTITASAGRAAVRPGDPSPTDTATGADAAAVVLDGDAPPPRTRIRDDIREGYGWLRNETVLWRLAVLLGFMNGTAFMSMSILALFALDVLGLSEIGFGLLATAGAIGGLAGSLTAARVVDAIGRGRALWGCLTMSIVAPVVQGLIPNVWLFAALMVLFSYTAVLWNVVTVSLRQTVIPDHLLGRVNAVYRFLGWGSMPLGGLLGGVVADAFGLRAPFLVAGALMAAVVLYARGVITTDRIEALRSRDATTAATDQEDPPT